LDQHGGEKKEAKSNDKAVNYMSCGKKEQGPGGTRKLKTAPPTCLEKGG